MSTVTTEQHLLDLNEVAARLHVSPRFIRKSVAAKTIPVVRIGRLVRFSSADIDAYIAARRISTAMASEG